MGLLLAGAFEPPSVSGSAADGVADVSKVFASWDEWQSAYDDLVSAIDAFEAVSKEPVDSAAKLVAVMQAHGRVHRVARDVEGYLYLRLQLNGTDEEARSREQLTEETDRRWYSTLSPWFDQTISQLGKEVVDRWSTHNEVLREYGFFFHRFFAASGHAFPKEHEELRRLSSISGRQSSRTYNALAITEAPVIDVVLESGEQLELNAQRAYTIFNELPQALDRRTVAKAWLEALGQQSQTYAALLEGIVNRHQLLAEVRGFDSALGASLHRDAVPAAAVRNVIRVARENSDPLRRYHLLRKQFLELPDYSLADRFIPLAPPGEETDPIEFEEARELIVSSSSALGSEVQNLVRRAFSEGWIDSVERPGKRANAGSTFVAGHPYVLVNYRGSLENVFQLTHEIGHAVHALIAYRSQPFVYSHRSSLTSEAIASVFEGAVVEEMVGRNANRSQKIRVLDLSIQNLLRLFYRPMLAADFELRLYEADVPITGPSLAALYLAVVEDFYGETVSLNDWDAHAWQQTPHYYTSPLYMGKYGLSTAAANILITQLTSPDVSEALAAQRAFLELMQSGSHGYPSDLLRVAGADLGDAETIQALGTRLESLVDRLERALHGTN